MAYSLYKPKQRRRLGRPVNSKKKGMAFQRKVKTMYNRKMARETINSGALWFDPGDISMEEFLIECKERKLTAQGEKYFTIGKDVLNKIDEEAGYSKPGIVVFGFSNDDSVYCIIQYDDLLELIHMIDVLTKEQWEHKIEMDGDNTNGTT